MVNPFLSICIPVYNQSNILKKSLTEILKYSGNDIEVIINDDCSNEDILGVVNSFCDERLKYFKNDINLGHDLNILQSFKNASTKYAFLLRTRDFLFYNSIPRIIELVREKPDLSYLTGQATDETGNLVITYKRMNYSSGIDALKAHMNLYIHPSGSLYAIDLIDLDRVENFLCDKYNDKYGFTFHTMIRLELALKGDFEIMNDTIWQYTNTLNSPDIAVNSTSNKESVYSPRLILKRLNVELDWADLILPKHMKKLVFRWLLSLYLFNITWVFQERNNNPKIHKHYNSTKINFSIKDGEKLFLENTNFIMNKYISGKINKLVFQIYIKVIIFDIWFFGIKQIIKKFIKKI